MQKSRVGFLGLLLAGIALFLFPGASFAEETGLVDVQKVMAESQFGKDFQKKLMDKQRELQDKFQKKADELKEMKSGKKEVSAAKIAEKEAELQTMQADLNKEFQDFNAKLLEETKKKLDEVLLAAQNDKKLSMILDKRAVLIGGTDITDDVIQRLSKK